MLTHICIWLFPAHSFWPILISLGKGVGTPKAQSSYNFVKQKVRTGKNLLIQLWSKRQTSSIRTGIEERDGSKAGFAPRAACSISHTCFHAYLLQEQDSPPYHPKRPRRSCLLTLMTRVGSQHSPAKGSLSHSPASQDKVKALTLNSTDLL